MTDPLVSRNQTSFGLRVVAKTLLAIGFALTTFSAGRLWSLREVREAQRAAGLAEQERLAARDELTACRNALVLLQRQRASAPGNPPGP